MAECVDCGESTLSSEDVCKDCGQPLCRECSIDGLCWECDEARNEDEEAGSEDCEPVA
jgi:hypothetical protein